MLTSITGTCDFSELCTQGCCRLEWKRVPKERTQTGKKKKRVEKKNGDLRSCAGKAVSGGRKGKKKRVRTNV